MKTNWDLTVFYKDFDDPQYAADMKALPEQVKALAALIEQKDDNAVRKVRAIADAMEALSITPHVCPIRGGTDGARLSFMGLPCPNLFTGGQNFHSRFEYIPVEDMESCTQLLIDLLTSI